MNKNDFRVGVNVETDGEIVLIDEDQIEIIMGSRNYKDYKGIPLTSEILRRIKGVKEYSIDEFGFEIKVGYGSGHSGYLPLLYSSLISTTFCLFNFAIP